MAITEIEGKKGTRYRVVYRDADGKQQSAGTYGTRKDAEREYTRAKLRVDDGLPAKSLKPPVQLYADETLGDYAPEWLTGHRLGAHSKANYGGILKSKLIPELGTTPLAAITVPVVKALFVKMEAEGASNAYISKCKTVLSALMQSAAEDPDIASVTHNPCRGVGVGGKRADRRKAITKAQFAKLLAEVPTHYRLFLRTIASSGLRVEEATGLRDSDLEITAAGCWLNVRFVLVETKGQMFTLRDGTKTGRDRRVKIDPKLAKDLAALPEGFMFLKPDGKHIGLDSFRKLIFKPAAHRAGLPDAFTVRDLRRCHASWLRDGGANLEAVRDRLGHATLAVTDRYLAEDKDAGDSALDALGDIPS